MVELAGWVNGLSSLWIIIGSMGTQKHCYIIYSQSNVIDNYCYI